MPRTASPSLPIPPPSDEYAGRSARSTRSSPAGRGSSSASPRRPAADRLDAREPARRDRALELSVPANALPPKKPLRLLGSLAVTGRVRHRRRDREPYLRHRIRVRRGRGPRPLPSSSSRSVTARLIAVSRAKRKARTIGNALGLTTLTGSVTPRADRPARSEDSGDPAPSGAGAARRAAQTALEVPYRPDPVAEPLRRLVSPRPAGDVRARPATPSSWHTRLGRPARGRHPDRRRLSAAHAAGGLGARPADATSRPPLGIPTHDTDPWRMSLDAFDRHNVMHLSSNFRLERRQHRRTPWYEPNPLDVGCSRSSSLGAWLDSRGVVAVPAADRARRSRSGVTGPRSDAITTCASSTPGSCSRSATARR